MKKTFLLILICLLLFSFISWGNENGKAFDNDDLTESDSVSTKVVYAINPSSDSSWI